MTTMTADLKTKIERRAKRAWRRQRDGATKSVSRISNVTDTELMYRVPYTPDYYGKEKIRVVLHNDGTIEVDPKTTGLIDCKSKSDLDRLKKHGGEVRAYMLVKAGTTYQFPATYRSNPDPHPALKSREQCIADVKPGDRVYAVVADVDDLTLSYDSFTACEFEVVEELDQEKDLGFTTGLVDCRTKADLDKLKKHIGEVRAYVLKKRPKKSLVLNKKHTLKTGERYVSREGAAYAARPGDKVYTAEFDYSDIDKQHTDGVTASGTLVEELDPVKDLGFTVGTTLDMLKNSDLKKLAKHDGMVRGYKYVTEDLKSPTQTGPEQISYKVGEEFEIPDADTDPGQTCARGINIATQEWCKDYAKPPKRALAFEFHSKDIAAIPTDGGKMRVYRCLCVEEVDVKTFKPITDGKAAGNKPKKKKGFMGKLFGSGEDEDEV